MSDSPPSSAEMDAAADVQKRAEAVQTNVYTTFLDVTAQDEERARLLLGCDFFMGERRDKLGDFVAVYVHGDAALLKAKMLWDEEDWMPLNLWMLNCFRRDRVRFPWEDNNA